MIPIRVGLLLALTLATPACSAAQLSRVPPRLEELTQLRPLLDTAGYVGTVVVHDLRRGTYRAVHGGGAARRRIPASTYKILNSLIALDAGVIASDSSVIRWDGVPRERTELNRDLNLREAFQISAVPHYQSLARRIGPDRMQRYVDRVGYGNRNISGGIDQFWLTGGLRVSPAEQVAFLTRLYRSELPFSRHAMETVKRMMIVEETREYTLRAKTGWAILPGGHTGWWVGWVERGNDVFVFATVLESAKPGSDFGPTRIAITRSVLQALDILPSPAA